MEQHINRIEILGRVGTVRLNEFNGRKVINCSVVTEIFIKKSDGSVMSESTWHNVNAWEGTNIADLTRIQKGSVVKVTGRLRNNKYTGSDGTEKFYPEILAYSLDIIQ